MTVVGINITRILPTEVVIEVNTVPTMWLGKQIMQHRPRGVVTKHQYNTLNSVDLTNGQMTNVPYHKVHWCERKYLFPWRSTHALLSALPWISAHPLGQKTKQAHLSNKCLFPSPLTFFNRRDTRKTCFYCHIIDTVTLWNCLNGSWRYTWLSLLPRGEVNKHLPWLSALLPMGHSTFYPHPPMEGII